MTRFEIPVYYINLDSSVARREKMQARLADLGVVNAHRVPAFDLRGAPLDTLAQYRPMRSSLVMGRTMLGSEIGCYQSHFECLKRIVESGDDYGIVMEDDAEIAAEFPGLVTETLARLDAAGLPWDVVHLGPKALKMGTEVAKLGAERTLFAAHQFPIRCHGLLWSREGARTFLRRYPDPIMPVDVRLSEAMMKRGRGFAILPPVVWQDGSESDIDGAQAVKRNVKKFWYANLVRRPRRAVHRGMARLHMLRFRMARGR